MVQFAKHPARLAAFAEDALTWRGADCPAHGAAERWTSSGQCRECGRERARVVNREPRVNIPRHPDRLAALANGDRTWRGPICRHGHDGLRYTSTTTCVACQQGRRRGA